MLRPKNKVVLFPEIGQVKIFLSPNRPHCRICIRRDIFCFKKTHTHKQKAKETKENVKKKKETETKEEKERCCCCEQYLLRIQRDTIISFANLLCVLLTYVISQ